MILYLFSIIILYLISLKEYKKPIFILLMIFLPLFLFYSLTGRGIFIRSIKEFSIIKKTDEGFSRGGVTTIGIRLHIWKACLRIIRDYPILGCGLDTMMTIYPRYRTLKHVRANQKNGILLAGLGGSWTSHHINNLFSFGIPSINLSFWVIMGLIISLLNEDNKDYYDGLLNTHLTLARTSLESSRTKKAVLFAKRSVKLFQEDSIAWNFLGGAYYMDGISTHSDKRDMAVYSYKHAVKFEPFLRDAYTNIGQIRFSQGRKGEAPFWFKKVLSFIPDDALSLHYIKKITSPSQ